MGTCNCGKRIVVAPEPPAAPDLGRQGATPDVAINAEVNEWANQKDPSEIPAYYASLYTAMARTARSLGYALALHGSMQRDLDVIAVPWTTEAVTADQLAEALMERHGLTRGTEREKHKPHGREAYVMMLSGHYYVDLSVMPIVHADPAPSAPPEEPVEVREVRERSRLAMISRRCEGPWVPVPGSGPNDPMRRLNTAETDPHRVLAYADTLRESLRLAREERDKAFREGESKQAILEVRGRERFIASKRAEWDTLKAEAAALRSRCEKLEQTLSALAAASPEARVLLTKEAQP